MSYRVSPWHGMKLRYFYTTILLTVNYNYYDQIPITESNFSCCIAQSLGHSVMTLEMCQALAEQEDD